VSCRALLILALATVLALPGISNAGSRALLIGVSEYDDAPGIADLKGPANDVRLLRRVLQKQGIERIDVLADGVDGAERPTRGAILARFADLAREAREGDFIYIHLSGHGTRQPDLEGDETDGLDEVFLPADTTRGEPGSTTIPNAIVDDEIGQALRAIRQTGADVWLVMDSCHSGSGTRAAALGTAARYVDPSVLGIRAQPSNVAEPSVLDEEGPAPSGGFLAFYSAQSTEVAREVNFAEGDGGEAWYGLFTAKLAARFESSEGLSFRQLFQAVLSDMNDNAVPGTARLQTPLWEGDMIDAVVLGGSDTVGVRRFAVAGDSVSAGMVHGLAEGTLLGLVADATDPPDALIGYAQTEDVSAIDAFLRPVSADCVPRREAPCPASGTLPDEVKFAQVVAHPVDLRVRLAPPRDLATAELLPESHRLSLLLNEAIATANEDTGPGIEISPVAFDIEIMHADGALWLGPRASSGGQPVGLSWRPGEEPDLAALLRRIARAETLARMLDSVAAGGSLLNPSPVQVETTYFPAAIERLAPPGDTVSPRRECRSAQQPMRGTPPVSLETGAKLKQCDSLKFHARGTVGGARDVNRIHIDAQNCVHAEHERIEDASAARELGPSMTVCSDCPGGYSAGTERLFVVVTESRANAEPLNLEGLVETCGTPSGGTRGAGPSDARTVLEALGRRPDTRGSFGGLEIADIWVESWTWHVLPRREAFRQAGRAFVNND